MSGHGEPTITVVNVLGSSQPQMQFRFNTDASRFVNFDRARLVAKGDYVHIIGTKSPSDPKVSKHRGDIYILNGNTMRNMVRCGRYKAYRTRQGFAIKRCEPIEA